MISPTPSHTLPADAAASAVPLAPARTVRVAGVQLHVTVGQTGANLAHATALVEQAARAGAQLVALPELAAAGYSLSDLLWTAAERRDGATTRWLRATARRLAIYLGTGFVEADGDDFFNAYALAAPTGEIAGFVRKTMAETAFFRCAQGAHVVGTPLGRIGIGICADNHFAPIARQMRAQRVDLMLMPHAVPVPIRTGGLVSTADMAETIAKLRGMAPLYARLLGVPAVFVNQVGARGRERWAGVLGGMMGPDQFHFGGLSTIAGGDGTVTAHLDDPVEGVVAAEVCLGRRGGELPAVPSYGRYGGGWLQPAPSGNAARDVVCYVDAAIGRAAYALSHRRRRAARIAASRSALEESTLMAA